jgi:MoxR-like ATPase
MSMSPENGGFHVSTGGNPRVFVAETEAARPAAVGVTVFCPLIAFAISSSRDTLTLNIYNSEDAKVMTEASEMVADIEALGEKLAEAKASITNRFIGQERVVDLTLTALLCGGHGLLIGLPGLGKTRLVETLSTVMGLDGNRVQFTPDLMPADILGSEVLDTAPDGSRAFRFVKGPIFCQLLMADEINRASPRTQSALLQAMQEKTVTVAGQDRPLGKPFHVLATQNPIEQEGTYPLPEAQLDRFLVQIDVVYPDRATERDILIATTGDSDAQSTQVFSSGELLAAQTLLRRMPVGDSVVEMILDLVRAFRPEEADASARVRETVAWGPGPRAAQALMLTVRARALLQGRLAPSAEDVIDMARPVLSHRMALNFAARARGDSLADLIDTTAASLTGKKAAA